MNKTIFVNTYGYENFITEDERLFLEKWAIENSIHLKPNSKGPFRNFGRLDSIPKIPKLVEELKYRLIELESIKNVIEAPKNGDWIGIQGETSFVEPHIDFNGEDDRYYTRRYNVLISLPEEGGQPVYDGNILYVKERMIWRCEAGLIMHSSVPNKGKKLRINLSFGFSVPKPGVFFGKKLL